MSIRLAKRGFTLVELLIVIAIIAILIALVTVAAGMMLGKAKSTKDSGNQRMLGQSTFSHSTDHMGKLLHPRTGPTGAPGAPSTQDQLDRLWIAAYDQDVNGDDRLVVQGGEYIEMKSALEEGAAFPYIGDVTAFQSPLDPTIGDVSTFVADGNFTNDRIRSYALNAFVGVEWGADDWTVYRDNPPLNLGTKNFWRSTETLSQIPQPASTMCSIGEQDSYGRNGHGWLVAPTNNFSSFRHWSDFPAFWDGRNVNMSFVDGSTGSITLESDKLKENWLQYGHDHFNLSNCEVEYKKFHGVLLPGVIGSILD